jgi:hypothetical protein
VIFIVIYKPVFVKLINAKIVIQTAVGPGVKTIYNIARYMGFSPRIKGLKPRRMFPRS